MSSLFPHPIADTQVRFNVAENERSPLGVPYSLAWCYQGSDREPHRENAIMEQLQKES